MPLIRPATLSDAALLTTLAATTMREAFGPPHNPAELVDDYIRSAMTQPVLEAELADPQSTFFVAETEDGTPIGYAKLRRHRPPRQMPAPYRQNAIEIQRIYLLQAQTGKGQGRQLMQHCLDYARNQGYKSVWLGVWEHNAPALVFYKKMGFIQCGWHTFLFGGERQRDFWFWKGV